VTGPRVKGIPNSLLIFSRSFGSCNSGYKKLEDHGEATALFDIDEKQLGNPPVKIVYLKDKKFKTKLK